MSAQLKSFAQAFSKACSFQRQSLWSLSAESETLLGEAQHLFFSKAVDKVHRFNFFRQ
jgi:hypothetical protein